ncbi:MAG: diguanylate cyclase [Desulfobacterales bacterium]|jgi:diguanylate cyclase (GGDEF)-like protein
MAVKILIVEDDVDVSETLIQFLIKSGFKAKCANSAEEAEEILKNEEIHMVLTDIKLPGTDGIKLTKNIKKKYGLDVIVMTGYSSEYFYEDAIINGASDLIFKPVKFNELLLRINRVLKERSLLKDHDKMIKELKRLTIEDSLTGLYNSRHFFEQLDKEIKRSDRYLHPISLIFIDIDNFKEVNDTYGHMIGDKILALIAKRIKACLRSNDSAYRFAGDEFTIILPETTASEAKIVAYRILSKFTKESFLINDKEISKITSSIGIAEYQINEGHKQFVHRADVTMYEAKQRGGNGVIISPAQNDPSATALPLHF